MRKWTQVTQKHVSLPPWGRIWTYNSKSSRCVTHRDCVQNIILLVKNTRDLTPLCSLSVPSVLEMWQDKRHSLPYILVMWVDYTLLVHGDVSAPMTIWLFSSTGSATSPPWPPLPRFGEKLKLTLYILLAAKRAIPMCWLTPTLSRTVCQCPCQNFQNGAHGGIPGGCCWQVWWDLGDVGQICVWFPSLTLSGSQLSFHPHSSLR